MNEKLNILFHRLISITMGDESYVGHGARFCFFLHLIEGLSMFVVIIVASRKFGKISKLVCEISSHYLKC